MSKYADGVNYAKQNDPTSANIVDPGLLGGKVRVFQDTVTYGATNINSSNYVIFGGKLPTGAQVVDIKLSANGATSASNTCIVGDEGDDDRYMTTVGLSSSTVLVGPTVTGGQYYTVTGTTDNYIRLAGSGAGAVLSGGTIKISIMYIAE